MLRPKPFATSVAVQGLRFGRLSIWPHLAFMLPLSAVACPVEVRRVPVAVIISARSSKQLLALYISFSVK